MKAFQVIYSEGDPTIVLAESFSQAEFVFVNHILKEVRADGDDTTTSAQVRDWIENFNALGSEVVTTMGVLAGIAVGGDDDDTVLL